MFLRSRRRRGFNLLEIMLSMFILALGLIMIAGSMPVALKQAADSQDVSLSTLVGRVGASAVNRFAHRDQLPIAGQTSANCCQSPGAPELMHWFDGPVDQRANGVVTGTTYTAGTTRRYIPSAIGNPYRNVAIPVPGDTRYAYNIFYRRVIMPGGSAMDGPFVFNVSVVLISQRDGLFRAPVKTSIAGWRNQMNSGDLYCTPAGVWRRYDAGVADADFGWGCPGGVAVFATTLTF